MYDKQLKNLDLADKLLDEEEKLVTQIKHTAIQVIIAVALAGVFELSLIATKHSIFLYLFLAMCIMGFIQLNSNRKLTRKFYEIDKEVGKLLRKD